MEGKKEGGRKKDREGGKKEERKEGEERKGGREGKKTPRAVWKSGKERSGDPSATFTVNT